MKDLGECNYFLGIQIVRDHQNRWIHLSQSAYINKVLATFQMEKAIGKSTPMELGTKKSITDYDGIATRTETTTYQSMIGSLMYAMTQTRPDLAYAVSFLSQFLQNPGPIHIKAAQRVLRYLKQTKNIGITYDGKQPGFCGYSDADYGEDIQTRKSRNGYVFYLYGGPISWKSARQKCVTLSSTESEYYGLSSAAREAAWLRLLLTELEYQGGDINPTTIKGDNQGSLALAENPEFHQRTKHVDIQYHYIRQEVENGCIALEFVPTRLMAADGYTKPLTGLKHEEFIRMLGLAEWKKENTKEMKADHRKRLKDLQSGNEGVC